MALPKQKIPLSEKTDEWKKNTINYFERLSYTSASGNRTSNFNKLVNYDLYNGRFNKADLEYVCNPLGLAENEFPAQLQHYDIISPPLNLLLGEEVKKNDNFIVISESTEDIGRKNEALKKKIMQNLMDVLAIHVDPSSQDPNNPPQTPEQILKYEKYNISDSIESQANKILKSLRKRLNMKVLFNRGWKDALITGEEIYYVGITNGEPVARRCNTVNMTVVLDGDTDFIDDALAVVETRMLAPATIVDEFGDKLTPAQLDELETVTRATSNIYQQAAGPNPTFVIDRSSNAVDTGVTSNFSTFGSTSGSFNSHLIRVVRVEWKSYKKLFDITYTDEDGIEQNEIVDETFKLSKFREIYPDVKAEEMWITEAWEGVKIGEDIYIEAQAKQNQRRRMDNPYACKLGYVGLIYNATNSVSTSLIDRLKAYQYLYNIISYRLELAFASDQGRKFVMDLAQVPRSEGMDLERWMYYMKAMGIVFINSHEEGRKGSMTGKTSQFNQFTSVDLSLANTIQQYIETLDHIKNQVAFISGVSPQRLGAISSQELVGNVERSVEQSAMITEYLFDAHNEVKRRVYVALIEAAKIAYREGKITQYVLDDMGIEMLNIEEFQLENSEFNVFLTNYNKDLEVVNTLKQLSRDAISMDKADLSTIIDTIINDNPSDIIKTLKRAEQAKYDRDAQIQQHQQQLQDQALKSEEARHSEIIDIERSKLDLQEYIANSNNETKIQVAEINALTSKEGPVDMDGDGIPDPIEIAKLSLEERDISARAFLEHSKLSHEKKKHDNEIAMKDKELKLKKEIEDKKIKAIQVQNASQEKIATQKIKADKELANKKLQIERIKAKKVTKPKK